MLHLPLGRILLDNLALHTLLRRRIGFNSDVSDIALSERFARELVLASNGKKTALSYLTTQLPAPTIQKKPYQVMVIGGTNFSEALVKKDKDTVEVVATSVPQEFSTFSKGEDVLNLILDNLRPKVDMVCINFAYPLEGFIRQGRLDGRLTEETRGHRYPDLLGKRLGEKIEKFVFSRTGRSIKVSIANDTVCLVLAGWSVARPEKVVGVIVGTGYNMGYFVDERTIVNLEASRFSTFKQTESGKAVSRELSGLHPRQFEIEVSGAYLYRHFNYWVKKKMITAREIASTADLFYLAFETDKNSDAVRFARKIVTSSAHFVAGQIVGCAIYKKSDIDVILEGGLINSGYRSLLDEQIKKLTKFSVTLHTLNNSTLLGAAYLV